MDGKVLVVRSPRGRQALPNGLILNFPEGSGDKQVLDFVTKDRSRPNCLNMADGYLGLLLNELVQI